jgi:hypothetical protein
MTGLTVTPPVLVSIAVTPANPSITVGATQQFTATGTYSDSSTQDLTASVTWTSSVPSVATINSSGLATAVAAGTTNIQATWSTISGTTALTVTTTPPPTATFGKTTAGNLTDTADSNSVIAGRFQSGTQGGTALSISVHAGATVSAAPHNQFQVALYADNAGTPGALIASSASATLNPSSWNTVAISAPISPSTWYWIAYNTNGSSTSANDLTLSAGSIAKQTQWINTESFGTWPATFGPIGGNSANQWDMYVTLAVK